MTDPIREIIEEMSAMSLESSRAMSREPLRHWASRLSAFWTPERAAFMEAAMMLASEWLDSDVHGEPRKDNEALPELEENLVDTYRALLESEKRDE